jgi:hypothetical protein
MNININCNEDNLKKLNYETINFELSDTESDHGSNTNFDYNVDILDDLELKYYPEPYNTIGQFILSAISGALSSYILSSRAKKNQSYKYHMDSYFLYCKKIKDDEYIDSLLDILKLDKTNDKDNSRFKIILDNINIMCNQLMDELIITDKYKKYLSVSNEDFSIESFNSDIIKDIIDLIKFNKLVDLKLFD